MGILTVRFFVLVVSMVAVMIAGASRIGAQEAPAESEPAAAEPVEETEKVVTHHLLDVGLDQLGRSDQVVLPTLSYTQSFAEGDLAIPIQAIAAEIGLLYELSPRWWLFYRPTIMREFELSETVLFNLLQVGREVGTRHGVSLEYGSVSDEVFSQAVGFRSNVNYRVSLRAHFGFR